MADMRAKFQVCSVEHFGSGEHKSEKVKFTAVAKSGGYPADGSDEDNTFAKWTPSATCEVHINNPALLGKFEPGKKYYVDFTEATQ